MKHEPRMDRLQRDIDELAGPKNHVVLSPHYDDMALSIGASMATFADSGRQVTDLIVFGAEPSGVALHDFAQHHHDRWGLTAVEVVNARRGEEARAVRILGADTSNLPFFDAIYRSDYYTSDSMLFGSPSPAESEMADRIATTAIEAARSLVGADDASLRESVRFYAPLAIGNHVDHQTVFSAACVLSAWGYVVWLFEDLPYAMIGDNSDRRRAALSTAGIHIEPVASVPTDTGWARKIEAVLAYPSQLETVFRNYAGVEPTPKAIDSALTEYHRSAGDGESVERFWRLRPTEQVLII